MSIPENMKQIADLASRLVKGEAASILPQDNMFVNKGWQCPVCGRVYSPTTPMCFYCRNKEIANQQTSKYLWKIL